MIQSATPYLILNGRAERALELYAQALGARAEMVQRFGDVDESCAEAQKELIMHAAVRIGNALVMMSDGPKETHEVAPKPAASSVSVALDFTDRDELHRCFDALGKTGTTVVPVFEAAWGLFGVVQDEFGVHWMFNCGNDQQASN